ncbi:recombinase family protein [Rhodococcus sp. (in: high G+C Gram-positive bacteria)]|uniref:recombinase family protein n=1 Tax=Rhodococcus sp. TaxID=1831 RepID=UPI003BB05968
MLRRVVTMSISGRTQESIARELNDEGVPTPAGSPTWYRSHVCRLLATRGAVELRAELSQKESADQVPPPTTRQCTPPVRQLTGAGQLPPRTSRAVQQRRTETDHSAQVHTLRCGAGGWSGPMPDHPRSRAG